MRITQWSRVQARGWKSLADTIVEHETNVCYICGKLCRGEKDVFFFILRITLFKSCCLRLGIEKENVV